MATVSVIHGSVSGFFVVAESPVKTGEGLFMRSLAGIVLWFRDSFSLKLLPAGGSINFGPAVHGKGVRNLAFCDWHVEGVKGTNGLVNLKPY